MAGGRDCAPIFYLKCENYTSLDNRGEEEEKYGMANVGTALLTPTTFYDKLQNARNLIKKP